MIAARLDRPSDRSLYILLSFVVLFWSFNYVAAKIALREFPPMLLIGLRSALAAAILVPFYLWREGTSGSVWTWRELRLVAPLGLCGVAANQLFFVLGLARTSVAHAAIVIATTPILVLLLASAAGQERLSARKLGGMAIAFSGILVLQLGPGQGSAATPFGDLLILLGALSFAGFTVLGKSVSRRHGGLTVNTIAYLSAGFVLAPVVLLQGSSFHYESVSAGGWWSLFYMSAFASVLAYLFFFYALTHIAASRVSVFSYLQPVLATLMAVPVLREPLHPGLFVGGSLALVGVFVTERS